MGDSREVEDTLLATAATTAPDDEAKLRPQRPSIPQLTTSRYRPGTEIGRGGMGRVVEAFDTQLGRTVALKEVLPGASSNLARRFVREIEITARLEHPAIVPIYDSGVTPDGRPFYIMRRLSGRPLDEHIARTRGIADRLTLLPAVLAAIDAIAHAHRRGVIHRDLKPSNILVGDLGESVVIDWGLAKVIGEEDAPVGPPDEPVPADSLMTQIGAVFGTPGFMAPEQARGDELGPRSDVYALGATLYHLLVGAPPHAGGSATDVIGRTLVRDVPKLADMAPSAPPELAAIVDKALAFEAEHRYADAAALGEDVRRFLSGQLVAAHRYTPRERLQRFARKHRTAIAVAAFAGIALAALAVFSVRRILVERDAATDARQTAIAEQRAAEAARDRLAERNDALLITQARSLLELNPTEALAVLKQVPPTSPRLPEARAVAHAAVTRGAWWAIQSADVTTLRAELSHDGRQLLQVTQDGMLRVWDLERRQLVIMREYKPHTLGAWLAGGSVIVFENAMVPELLVPSANASDPLPLPLGSYVQTSEDGSTAVALGNDGTTWRFEVATNRTRQLWPGHAVKEVALARDGAWSVLADDSGLVVVDRDGRELFQRAGKVSRIVAGPERRFAVSTGDALADCTLDPVPACSEVPLDGGLVVDFIYRNKGLSAIVNAIDLVTWNGKQLFRRGRVDERLTPMAIAANDYMVIGGRGELQLLGWFGESAVKLPALVNPMRLATRRDQSRVVVVANGIILGLDLATCVPRLYEVPPGTNARLVDDDTALGWRSQSSWAWIDLARGQHTGFEVEMRGLAMGVKTEAVSRRTVVLEGFPGDARLWMLRPGKDPQLLLKGATIRADLVPSDGVVVAGTDDPDRHILYGAVGEGPVHELGKLDSPVLALAGIAPGQFVAISERGELVRGDVQTGILERAREAKPAYVALAGDGLGNALVAIDQRLVWWTNGKLVEVARFPQQIRYIHATEGGSALVSLADRNALVVKLEAGATPRHVFMASTAFPAVSDDGRTLVSLGAREELLVAELPSLARWSVPRFFSPTANFEVTVSPSSRKVLIPSLNGLAVWTLPTSGADFGAWLDEQTNATVADDVLVWPWQTTGNPLR
jgi:hypothetical protein